MGAVIAWCGRRGGSRLGVVGLNVFDESFMIGEYGMVLAAARPIAFERTYVSEVRDDFGFLRVFCARRLRG